MELGRHGEAAATLERAVALDPDNARFDYILAGKLLEQAVNRVDHPLDMLLDAVARFNQLLVAGREARAAETFAVLAELQSTWNRLDAMEFAAIFAEHIIPGYRALMESYDKAQSVQKGGRETKLDRLETARAKK